MAEAAFEINGEVIPFTTSPRLKDARLVEKVTGLSFAEYAEREATTRENMERGVPTNDPMVMIGLVAMSVSRVHPDWSVERVAEFCDDLEFESITTTGGDDADPPVHPAAMSSPSSASSNAPTDTPEAA